MAETASMNIHVTPKAVAKIKEAFQREGVSGGLRLGVLEPNQRPNDHVFEFDGVKIYIDPKSMLYLNGVTLDYKESLMYSGFSFENPNARQSCSCGSSFTA